MFQTDSPISNAAEDILSRSDFARWLGSAILSQQSEHSIVLSLHGPWGSGKSSVLNMATEHIKYLSKSCPPGSQPIILRFNPWNYTSQDQLIRQFFDALIITLNQRAYSKVLKRVGKELRRLSSIIEPLRFISKIGFVASITSYLSNKCGQWITGLGGSLDQLESIKERINALLRKQQQKIIVTIDDIDRCSHEEIRIVFQLVKSIADFANTRYLLAFDKGVVSVALAEAQAGASREYLEKIIQVPFELPEIPFQRVRQVLLDKLLALLQPGAADDRDFLTTTYHSSFKYLFENLRDVERFMNILRFYLDAFAGEVYLPDLIVITGVQVLAPTAYQLIKTNRRMLIDQTPFLPPNSRPSGIREEWYSEIKGAMPQLSEEQVRHLLHSLFPTSTSGNGIIRPKPSTSTMSFQRRLAIPSISDFYFSTSRPQSEFSRSEAERVIHCADDFSQIWKHMFQFRESGRILGFLEQIEVYVYCSKISSPQMKNLLIALIDLGDTFPEMELASTQSTFSRLARLFKHIRNSFPNEREAIDAFATAIRTSRDSLFTCLLATAHDMNLPDLHPLVCERIAEWFSKGKLTSAIRIRQILGFARDHGDAAEYRKYLSVIQDDLPSVIRIVADFRHLIANSPEAGNNGVRYRFQDLTNLTQALDVRKVKDLFDRAVNNGALAGLDRSQIEIIYAFLAEFKSQNLDKRLSDTPNETVG